MFVFVKMDNISMEIARFNARTVKIKTVRNAMKKVAKFVKKILN